MKWGPIFFHAWRALMRHKLRTFLSTMGIVFAVLAVVSMLAIAEGAKHEIIEQIKGLGANNIIIRTLALTDNQESTSRKRLSNGLGLWDVQSLERTIPSITHIAPVKKVRATLFGSITQDPFEILAVTSAYQQVKGFNLHRGRFICDTDVTMRNLVCVLGSEISNLLGDRGHVGDSLRLGDRLYRIVGILKERRFIQQKSSALSIRNFNRAVFIPMGSEMISKKNEKNLGEISEIWIRLEKNENMSACATVVRRILSHTHSGVMDFQVIVPQELLIKAQKTQRIFNMVLGCIAGISLVVGGIGIMNTMLASVAERTKEIGIRRSIGANRQHIALQFLSESILLTTIGGCIGVVCGTGSALVISTVAGWKTLLTPWSICISILMAGLVGLISGLYPALRAAFLDPAKAMRHE